MKKLLLVILIIIAGLGLVIETRPGSYHVERSATVAAPPEAVYPHVADLRQWGDWSPWDKLDPAMKKDFAGPPGEVGSSYHWAGNDKVGEGRMTVTRTEPGRSVGFDLDFLKPFAARCQTGFTLAPDPAGTKVTWTMDGSSNFMAKAMELFAGNMDRMVGPFFETGLAQLKQVAEAAPADSGATAGSGAAPGTAPAPTAKAATP